MKPLETPAADVKQCCARLYESDFAKLLLGESFHPGGLKLTERLGQLLQLGPSSHVLDVASGRGTSAIFLAQHFGCEVIGLDYGPQNVAQANDVAARQGLSARVRFEQADAESIPYPNSSFDAVVCECAFCTFPDKSKASDEFARVLRGAGRVGISDLTRVAELPKELDGLLAWIACIAAAEPIEEYLRCFRNSGLRPVTTEPHDNALIDMVRQIQGKLLGVEIVAGLKKIDLPGLDLAATKQMATVALAAIQRGATRIRDHCGREAVI